MSVQELAQHTDQNCKTVALALINLIETGKIEAVGEEPEVVIADLRNQIATGVYR